MSIPRREAVIREIENRIKADRSYRKSLITQANSMSYSNPIKEWLYRRAEALANNILNSEESLDTHRAALAADLQKASVWELFNRSYFVRDSSDRNSSDD